MEQSPLSVYCMNYQLDCMNYKKELSVQTLTDHQERTSWLEVLGSV